MVDSRLSPDALTDFEKEYYVRKRIIEDGLWDLLTDKERDIVNRNVWDLVE